MHKTRGKSGARWATSSAVVGIVTLASNLAAAQAKCPTASSPNPTPVTMTPSQLQQAMQNLGAQARVAEIREG